MGINFSDLINQLRKKLKLNIDDTPIKGLCLNEELAKLADKHPDNFGNFDVFIDDCYQTIEHIFCIQDKKVVCYLAPDMLQGLSEEKKKELMQLSKTGFVFADKQRLAEFNIISQENLRNDWVIPLLYSFLPINEQKATNVSFTNISLEQQKNIHNLFARLHEDYPNFIFIPIDDYDNLPSDIHANIIIQSWRVHDADIAFVNNLTKDHMQDGYFYLNLDAKLFTDTQDVLSINRLALLYNTFHHEAAHIFGLGHPFKKYQSQNYLMKHVYKIYKGLHNIYSHTLFYNTCYGWYDNHWKPDQKTLKAFPVSQNHSALTHAIVSSLYPQKALPKVRKAVYSFYQQKGIFPAVTEVESNPEQHKQSIFYAMHEYDQTILAETQTARITVKGDLSGYTIQPQFVADYTVFDFGNFGKHFYSTEPLPEKAPALFVNLQPLGNVCYSSVLTEYNHVETIQSTYITQIGTRFERIDEVVLSDLADTLHVTSPLYKNLRIIATPHGQQDGVHFYHGDRNQVVICENIELLGVFLQNQSGVIIDFTQLSAATKSSLSAEYNPGENLIAFVYTDKSNNQDALAYIAFTQGITKHNVEIRMSSADSKKIAPLFSSNKTSINLAQAGF